MLAPHTISYCPPLGQRAKKKPWQGCLRLKNWTVGWPGNEAKLCIYFCFWLPLATTGAVCLACRVVKLMQWNRGGDRGLRICVSFNPSGWSKLFYHLCLVHCVQWTMLCLYTICAVNLEQVDLSQSPHYKGNCMHGQTHDGCWVCMISFVVGCRENHARCVTVRVQFCLEYLAKRS